MTSRAAWRPAIRARPSETPPATAPPPGAAPKGRHFVVVAPVTEGSTRLGSVYLRTDAETLLRQARRYTGIALLVLMASLLIGVLAIAQSTVRGANARLSRQADDLRAVASRQRAIFDAAFDAIVTLNPSGGIESVNRAAERMFGYPAKELLHRDISLLIDLPAAGRGVFPAADRRAEGAGRGRGQGSDRAPHRRDPVPRRRRAGRHGAARRDPRGGGDARHHRPQAGRAAQAGVRLHRQPRAADAADLDRRLARPAHRRRGGGAAGHGHAAPGHRPLELPAAGAPDQRHPGHREARVRQAPVQPRAGGASTSWSSARSRACAAYAEDFGVGMQVGAGAVQPARARRLRPADPGADQRPVQRAEVLAARRGGGCRHAPGKGTSPASASATAGRASRRTSRRGSSQSSPRRIRPTPARRAGPASGLAISKEIVERHGGRLWFETARRRGHGVPCRPAGDRGDARIARRPERRAPAGLRGRPGRRLGPARGAGGRRVRRGRHRHPAGGVRRPDSRRAAIRPCCST